MNGFGAYRNESDVVRRRPSVPREMKRYKTVGNINDEDDERERKKKGKQNGHGRLGSLGASVLIGFPNRLIGLRQAAVEFNGIAKTSRTIEPMGRGADGRSGGAGKSY